MSGEFKEIYPNGLNRTIVSFEKAFHKIMSTDEIDKVMKYCNKRTRKHLKGLKESFDKDRKWYEYHWLILLNEIQSIELLRDIIGYMVTYDDNHRVMDDYDEAEHKSYVDEIKASLSERDLLEGLAEEAAELSQAALKVIRAKEMGNNTTPMTEEDATENLMEEISDVLCYMKVMGVPVPDVNGNKKWKRWAERCRNRKEG